MCDSPLTLAQQLTHIELERLSMIDPEEFVQAFALEKNNKDVSQVFSLPNSRNCLLFKQRVTIVCFAEQDMAMHFNFFKYFKYVYLFNRLSYFIATEICMVRTL